MIHTIRQGNTMGSWRCKCPAISVTSPKPAEDTCISFTGGQYVKALELLGQDIETSKPVSFPGGQNE